MKPTNTYDFTIGANGTYRLLVEGDYFKILSATGAVDVEADWGRLVALTTGQGLEDSPFKYLVFRDRTGGANALRVVIGDEKFIDGVSGQATITSNVVPRSNVFGQAAFAVTTASQQALASNTARQYLLIQNTHATGYLFIKFGSAASLTDSIKVPPGGAYESGSVVSTQAVHIIGDIAGTAVIVEG